MTRDGWMWRRERIEIPLPPRPEDEETRIGIKFVARIRADGIKKIRGVKVGKVFINIGKLTAFAHCEAEIWP